MNLNITIKPRILKTHFTLFSNTLFALLILLFTSCHSNNSLASKPETTAPVQKNRSNIIDVPSTFPKTFNGQVWLKGNGKDELSIFLESVEDENQVIDMLAIFQQVAFTKKIDDLYFKQGRVTLHEDYAVIEDRTPKTDQRYLISLSTDLDPYLTKNSELIIASIYKKVEFFNAKASKTRSGKRISHFLKKGNGYNQYSTIDDFMEAKKISKSQDRQENKMTCAAGGEGSTSSRLANNNGSVSIVSNKKGYYTCCYYQVVENEYVIPLAKCLKYP